MNRRWLEALLGWCGEAIRRSWAGDAQGSVDAVVMVSASIYLAMLTEASRAGDHCEHVIEFWRQPALSPLAFWSEEPLEEPGTSNKVTAADLGAKRPLSRTFLVGATGFEPATSTV